MVPGDRGLPGTIAQVITFPAKLTMGRVSVLS
jgi:hypothetical protein